MDCATLLRQYARYLLVIFNFFFVLTGILLVSVGASVKAYYHEYDVFLDDKFFYASDLVIVVGVIIFIIAFFGCCGAIKENACMTVTFSSLLIVIFILELLVGIGGVVLKYKANDMIEKSLSKAMQQYDTPNNTEITALWDHVQEELKCCGVDNYTDWIFRTNTTKQLLPISCCDFPAGSTGAINCTQFPDAHNQTYFHTHGCLEVFSNYIENHALSIESVGLALAVIQLLGIILSCYLTKQIKSDYEAV